MFASARRASAELPSATSRSARLCPAITMESPAPRALFRINSLSGLTTKRVDWPFGASLTVTFKQVEKWLGYAPTVSVGYVRHASNISDFSYSRFTPQVEVSLGVLSF